MHLSKLPIYCLFIYMFGQAVHAEPYIVGVAPSIPKPLPQIKKETHISQKKLSDKKVFLKQQITSITSTNEIVPSKTQAWQAVFNYLSNETSLDLKYERANSQLDFELKLAKGYYDLAYVNPLQFVAFNDYPGYKAVAKRKAQPLRGLIFVKRGGRINSLSELRDATIAFPGLLNFPASIVPRESLQRLRFNVVPRFLASEKQVFRQVMQGYFIAGSGTQAGFDAQTLETQNSLKIVWNSPGFTPHAFVAHPRVPFFSINKLQRAMVRMNKREEGKALLPYIFVNNGFEVARDRDWDEINSINLAVLNGTTKRVQAIEPTLGQ